MNKIDYIHKDTRTLPDTITGEIQTITRWQDPTIEEYKKEIERLKKDKKKVLELIENDYFEDGSFENYYKVLNILKEGK